MQYQNNTEPDTEFVHELKLPSSCKQCARQLKECTVGSNGIRIVCSFSFTK